MEGAAGLEGTKLTFLVSRAGEIDSVAIALEPNVREIIFTRKPKPQEKASAQN
jgi:hypothetical protein